MAYADYDYYIETYCGTMPEPDFVRLSRQASAYAKSGEKKRYTGQAIQYSGGGTRGKEWDKRMMADRGDEVVKAVAKHVGGRAK